MSRGIVYALCAYGLWGLLPIYWKLLLSVPPLEILGHRVAWSLPFVVLLLSLTRNWGWARPALRSGRILGTFLCSGLLVGGNWGLYIWAVNTGHIVETALGYFINPLVNVFLGFVFLRERLRPGQWWSIGVATCGVAWLTWSHGELPWISLVLAFSFALYALLRKTASLGSLEGLTLETGFLFLPAIGYLFLLERQGVGVFAHGDLKTTLLLAFGGVATAVPLLFFAACARRLPLTTVGLLQYIAPSIQFCLGVFVYGEAFGWEQGIGFGLIWISLAIYSAEGLAQARRRRREGPADPQAGRDD